MAITPKQKRKLMSEYQKTGKVSQAALQADMDRKTARKLLNKEKPWEDGQASRSWRTRVDPFDVNWSEGGGKRGQSEILGIFSSV